MQIINPLKIAYRALRVHKVRSLLTVLGLFIGVMSIILVMNMGQGLENFIMGQMDMFGSGYIDIEPKVPENSRAAATQQGSITTLTIADAEEIAKHPNVRDYYIGVMGQKIVSYQDTNKSSLLFGLSAPGFDLYGPDIEFGRPFTDEEDKSLAQLAVLGQGIKEDLFGDSDPLGARIKIGKLNFRVIGVMEEQGTVGGIMDMNDMLYVPVRTLQKKIMGINHIQFIMAFMKDTSQADVTAADMKLIMREQHEIPLDQPGKDDFSVMTTEEMTDMLDTITGAITLLLIAIASISLLVGGVGIMNIMYVSVSERTYEIGLRKSVGATNSNILWQFLWEAIFLTFVGGLVGVILGTFFTYIAMLVSTSLGFDFGNIIAFQGVFLGVGFSVIVGLIFGLTPARKAANMQPVDALRHE